MADRIYTVCMFGILTFAVGILTGLFLHYMDHGWPAPRQGFLPVRWVYPVMFVSYGVLVLGAAAYFAVLAAEVSIQGEDGGKPSPVESRGSLRP